MSNIISASNYKTTNRAYESWSKVTRKALLCGLPFAKVGPTQRSGGKIVECRNIPSYISATNIKPDTSVTYPESFDRRPVTMPTHSMAVMSAAAAAALNQSYTSGRFMSTRSNTGEQQHLTLFSRRRLVKKKSFSATSPSKKHWKKLNRCVHSVLAFSKTRKEPQGRNERTETVSACCVYHFQKG